MSPPDDRWRLYTRLTRSEAAVTVVRPPQELILVVAASRLLTAARSILVTDNAAAPNTHLADPPPTLRLNISQLRKLMDVSRLR